MLAHQGDIIFRHVVSSRVSFAISCWPAAVPCVQAIETDPTARCEEDAAEPEPSLPKLDDTGDDGERTEPDPGERRINTGPIERGFDEWRDDGGYEDHHDEGRVDAENEEDTGENARRDDGGGIDPIAEPRPGLGDHLLVVIQ